MFQCPLCRQVNNLNASVSTPSLLDLSTVYDKDIPEKDKQHQDNIKTPGKRRSFLQILLNKNAYESPNKGRRSFGNYDWLFFHSKSHPTSPTSPNSITENTMRATSDHAHSNSPVNPAQKE